MDEVLFSKETIGKLCFANVYHNQEIEEKKYYCPFVSVIAGISVERGVEAILLSRVTVDRWKFIEFLEKLRAMNGNKRVHCFLDNARTHKTQETYEAYERLNLEPILNVPYAYWL